MTGGLPNGLGGEDFGSGGGVAEAEEPVAGDAGAVGLRRGEFPVACGSQGEIGEVAARARRIEFGIGDVAGRIDANFYADSNGARDGAARAVRNFRQNFVKHGTICRIC